MKKEVLFEANGTVVHELYEDFNHVYLDVTYEGQLFKFQFDKKGGKEIAKGHSAVLSAMFKFKKENHMSVLKNYQIALSQKKHFEHKDEYFESLPTATTETRKHLKASDIKAFYYCSNPLPLSIQIVTFIGEFNQEVIFEYESERKVLDNAVVNRLFDAFRENLVNDIKIQTYKKNYEPKDFIIDGHTYQIYVELYDGSCIKVHGSNAYPKTFDLLMKTLEDLNEGIL